MKDRSVWVFVAFALLLLGGLYLLRRNPAAAPAPAAPVAVPGATPPAATAPANTPPKPTSGQPEIPIGRGGPRVPVQDGKTIDMSSGRPVVQDDARSRAAIEKAKKEMEAAASEVTFAPRPAPQKKSEPAPKP